MDWDRCGVVEWTVGAVHGGLRLPEADEVVRFLVGEHEQLTDLKRATAIPHGRTDHPHVDH